MVAALAVIIALHCGSCLLNTLLFEVLQLGVCRKVPLAFGDLLVLFNCHHNLLPDDTLSPCNVYTLHVLVPVWDNAHSLVLVAALAVIVAFHCGYCLLTELLFEVLQLEVGRKVQLVFGASLVLSNFHHNLLPDDTLSLPLSLSTLAKLTTGTCSLSLGTTLTHRSWLPLLP